MLVEERRVAEAAVGVAGVVGHGAEASPAEALVQPVGGTLADGVEDEECLPVGTCLLLEPLHQRPSYSSPPGAPVHKQLCDVGAVLRVRRPGVDELHRADELAVDVRGEQNARPALEIGKDRLVERTRVWDAEPGHEADRVAAFDSVDEDGCKLTDRIARGRRVEPLHLHRHAPMLCDDPAVTLPHLDVVSLTDGGMETTLIFHHGLDLPHFAAFTLLANEQGRDALSTYYDTYLDVAEEYDHPIVLDTATWRANTDWGELLGYSADALDEANRDAVALVRAAVSRHSARVVVSGAIGPRGDGYVAGLLMSAHDAQGYHGPQVRSLAAAGVDVVSAITMTYADEAIGIVRAAAGAGVPSVVSFTVETDGRLPSGQTLADAVAAVDAETARAPAYYMVNCAHPTHFAHVLDGSQPLERIRGVRVNASAKSHAELDEAEELDMGDPAELAAHVASLRGGLPHLSVFGGCCGTDHRHIAALAAAVAH